ncbi:MAG: helix-turn-helix domain-containing protein [Alphaproteobacteria bacterium]|nr:helix-turn-helix domain-containing protein [Alphaproteobacteria bacterium]
MTTTKSKKACRGRTPSGQPNPIDVHVGNRIRLRRTTLGWSQDKLASMLGLTFQQVQKYERGHNRVSASRLWDFGNVMNTDINFFFEDMGKDVASQSPRVFASDQTAVPPLKATSFSAQTDPMERDETYELVKAYYKIKNRKTAHVLRDLIMIIAKTNNMFKDEEDKK